VPTAPCERGLDDVEAVRVERLFAHDIAHRLELVGHVQPVHDDIDRFLVVEPFGVALAVSIDPQR